MNYNYRKVAVRTSPTDNISGRLGNLLICGPTKHTNSSNVLADIRTKFWYSSEFVNCSSLVKQ